MKVPPFWFGLALFAGGCITEPAPDEPVVYMHPAKKHWWQHETPAKIVVEDSPQDFSPAPLPTPAQ